MTYFCEEFLLELSSASSRISTEIWGTGVQSSIELRDVPFPKQGHKSVSQANEW